MRFFFDNDLPPAWPVMLGALYSPEGHEFQHLRDKFDPGDTDEEWIPRLAAEGEWIVVSGDFGIRSKRTWLAAGLTTFFLNRSWFKNETLARHDMSWRLLKLWPEIVRRAEKARAGTGFRVRLRGGIITF